MEVSSSGCYEVAGWSTELGNDNLMDFVSVITIVFSLAVSSAITFAMSTQSYGLFLKCR